MSTRQQRLPACSPVNSNLKCIGLCIVFCLLVNSADSLIRDLHIKNDMRSLIRIDDFGLVSGGVYNLSIHKFHVYDGVRDSGEEVGFLVVSLTVVEIN